MLDNGETIMTKSEIRTKIRRAAMILSLFAAPAHAQMYSRPGDYIYNQRPVTEGLMPLPQTPSYQPPVYQAPPQTHCTTSYVGNFAYTNCY